MRATDVHALLGRAGWLGVLTSLGIEEAALSGRKNLPCPACGGRDRFTFDNRKGRGDFFCRHCGPGNGFDLLMRTHGWDFRTALSRVVEAARLGPIETLRRAKPHASQSQAHAYRPSGRSIALLRSSCAVADCGAVVRYLVSRELWPLPQGHALRAHAAADYWHEGQRVGRFAALLAPIVDRDGVLASLHVTYVDSSGRKLSTHPARKMLNKLEGHDGCAVRITPTNEALGIAEGIETSLAAAALHGIPVWSAINATLLSKFEPPASVHRLVIFADRDAAGLEAAIALRERLDGRCIVETRIPRQPSKDWNDSLLLARGGRGELNVWRATPETAPQPDSHTSDKKTGGVS